ncbi:endolytic transglycosylase MltG [Pseudoduganella danionis]|uniref:Endolytic murein transglycosylase n=1 Tax=Pseudoduganella danionis TaxID=1890295 RepID=A0ABW9SS00_9BURK|nr:endolytic transglycosylase MltG [Pseudoduganella danionis]MTW34605.1 endolytic transglycosylase MltG [Pseudoduganella danionis]
MAFVKKIFILLFLGTLAGAGYFMYWSQHPIVGDEIEPIEFSIAPGSGAHAAGQQIAEAGAPVQPLLFNLLARITSKSGKLKAGTYELKPGTTPLGLLDQLVRGEFAQEQLTIIEGWTFRQMRAAVAAHQGLKHDSITLTDKELLSAIGSEFNQAEGLFFPDTYLFAKGSSDLHIYRQAHAMLLTRLNDAWARRDPALPYKTPYDALIMASIVEKETGQKSERGMIAGVFVNRLKIGMMLQTDPTVIYGMGARYDGKIHKSDLETDTPYNTYTRNGLPPTPIALPGLQSLAAALAPAKTGALYFVSKGNGTSQFSDNLTDHNRAVNKYQR